MTEELYISKEAKEKMLLHQRANHADQKQQKPQKVRDMRDTTSQFEISGKNHISQNVFLPSVIYPSEKKKKKLEQAAFWHEVKVVCCLPNPFLHYFILLIHLSPCFITPCFINPCFINPVHVLPIQSSPCCITCHKARNSHQIQQETSQKFDRRRYYLDDSTQFQQFRSYPALTFHKLNYSTVKDANDSARIILKRNDISAKKPPALSI